MKNNRNFFLHVSSINRLNLWGLDEIFPKSSQRDDITANNSTTKISFSKAKAFLVKTRELGSTEDGFSWKSCSKWPMNQNHLNKIFLHTRPKICYAMENLLLHHSISSRHLSKFRPVEISMYMS